jgi:hypothetical protein
VSVENKPYWTTGELLAMAQDCEKTFKDNGMGINFHFYGKDTLVSEIWNKSEELDKTLPSYKDMFQCIVEINPSQDYKELVTEYQMLHTK